MSTARTNGAMARRDEKYERLDVPSGGMRPRGARTSNRSCIAARQAHRLQTGATLSSPPAGVSKKYRLRRDCDGRVSWDTIGQRDLTGARGRSTTKRIAHRVRVARYGYSEGHDFSAVHINQVKVAPSSATLPLGAAQSFTASGVWSDGTTGPVHCHVERNRRHDHQCGPLHGRADSGDVSGSGDPQQWENRERLR